MDIDVHHSVSLRASRRPDRLNDNFDNKGGDGFVDGDKSFSNYPTIIIWKRGIVRLLLAGGIMWMLLILAVLLFHIWSCQSSLVFLSATCNKDSTIYHMLHIMGLVTPPHRCSIPLASDPEKVVIPEKRFPSKFVQSLSYFEVDDNANTTGSDSFPLFGGHQSWKQRDDSFKLKSSMKVHCGFMRDGGADMSLKDIEYVKKCKFVVASGIFDKYDTPHQPSNVSPQSKKLFCFLMVVDEISLKFIKQNFTVKEDNNGGEWVGIWRIILQASERTGYSPTSTKHISHELPHYSKTNW
ncbi:uncharacterized protein [Rutidosis leptorrhynchoides]|uniref:uncharacterized protein n=1 Tax=Rutidosis leptorrhynchoides TaxID=125765 RepID=UPI003A9A3EB1